MILDAFKIEIYQTELNLDNNLLQSFCKDYQQHNKTRQISNVGGYQSDNLDIDNEILLPFVEQLRLHASEYIDMLFIDADSDIASMWFNVNKHGDRNINHNHPDSSISGVYYVKTPENCGNIIFNNPGKSIEHLWFNWQDYKTSNIMFPARENILYLFPAWLNHFVESNMNETEERISISFNISPSE